MTSNDWNWLWSHLSLHFSNVGRGILWCGSETGQTSTRNPNHLTRRWVDSSNAVGAAGTHAPPWSVCHKLISLSTVPRPSHARPGIYLGLKPLHLCSYLSFGANQKQNRGWPSAYYSLLLAANSTWYGPEATLPLSRGVLSSTTP